MIKNVFVFLICFEQEGKCRITNIDTNYDVPITSMYSTSCPTKFEKTSSNVRYDFLGFSFYSIFDSLKNDINISAQLLKVV
jgi:hypothetical protein